MMPAISYSYLSSRLVKEVYRLGGSIKGLVPEVVEQHLAEKVRSPKIAKISKRAAR
jgi:pantetheine-phosphate adenylyltransferase